jgi:hypothetical protein
MAPGPNKRLRNEKKNETFLCHRTSPTNMLPGHPKASSSAAFSLSLGQACPERLAQSSVRRESFVSRIYLLFSSSKKKLLFSYALKKVPLCVMLQKVSNVLCYLKNKSHRSRWILIPQSILSCCTFKMNFRCQTSWCYMMRTWYHHKVQAVFASYPNGFSVPTTFAQVVAESRKTPNTGAYGA